MGAKRAGSLDEAAGKFRQALEPTPDNVDAHWRLAWVLAGQEKNQEAIGHFEQVLKLTDDPERTRQAPGAVRRLH
ncbi:MAG: tetratricopeptide repeat protein [Armatimonadetes bacterium]|nr:tetratricopeptide repeat protein [Armatimonadota bacterium]